MNADRMTVKELVMLALDGDLPALVADVEGPHGEDVAVIVAVGDQAVRLRAACLKGSTGTVDIYPRKER